MRPSWILAGGAAITLMLGSAALADTAPAKPAEKQSCFFSSQWQGWHAPNDKTLYLRVNLHDIYRVDLSYGSSMLTWPDAHLVNIERGTSSICAPIDLDLSVAENDGSFKEHLFAKAITKLSPEEVAAIPKKDLP